MIKIKRGDTGIGLRATLSDENGIVDLTGLDIMFIMKNQTVTVIGDENGQVIVPINHGMTSEVGLYNCEFQVTHSDGKIETYPNDGYLQIRIIKDLGGN